MRVTVAPEQIRAAFEAVKDDPSFEQSRGLWERGRMPVKNSSTSSAMRSVSPTHMR